MSSKGKQRDPPPALFHAPPSQNVSHVTLPGILHPNTNLVPNANTVAPIPSASIQGMNTSFRANRLHLDKPSYQSNTSRADNKSNVAPGSNLPRTALPRQQQASEGQKQADRTDALWAEMQSTLEEVELSAANGTHVFGAEHSKALESLRDAQIKLAQAWARSEAVDIVEEMGSRNDNAKNSTAATTEGEKNFGASNAARPGSSGVDGREKHEKRPIALDQETAADILSARKRREANDRYFMKVNAGVIDVVAKLEDVAAAMRAVEQESRDIWGDTDSLAE